MSYASPEERLEVKAKQYSEIADRLICMKITDSNRNEFTNLLAPLEAHHGVIVYLSQKVQKPIEYLQLEHSELMELLIQKYMESVPEGIQPDMKKLFKAELDTMLRKIVVSGNNITEEDADELEYLMRCMAIIDKSYKRDEQKEALMIIFGKVVSKISDQFKQNKELH